MHVDVSLMCQPETGITENLFFLQVFTCVSLKVFGTLYAFDKVSFDSRCNSACTLKNFA